MKKRFKRVISLVVSAAIMLNVSNVSSLDEQVKSNSIVKAATTSCLEIAEPAGYLATYVAKYEPNMGVEFAQFPSKEYTDTYRTDVLFYGLSKDGKEFTALNNDKAVMSPEGCQKLGAPSLFRKGDGSYGLVASADNGMTYNTRDQIILFDSYDLLYFENQRTVKLNDEGLAVINPHIQYDSEAALYNIYWESDDNKSYLTTTKDFETFSEPEETDYSKATVEGTLPDYAVEEEASVFALTKEEYDRIDKKYSKLHSISVETNDIKINPGEEVVLPEKLNVIYSDGSKTPMGVEWNTAGLNLKNLSKGEYTVTGKMKVTKEYGSPLANYRADPYAIYDEEKGVYYFTGSNMNEKSASGGGAYQSLVIRQAETIDGITDAEEYEIWTDRTLDDGTKVTGWYWAPEIHKIGGKWRMIAQASVTEPGGSSGSKQCIFTCNGDDLTDPDNWEYTGYIHNTTDNQSVGAFDTTYFEYDGQSYYVTPKSSKIWITTVDPEDPLYPTGPLVLLSSADRAYETNNGSGKAGYNNMGGGVVGQAIQEASAVLMHDGKIFVAYAGCTIDMMYCVCLIYADLDSDLMDPDSWQKYPYPVLGTQDLTTTLKKADYYATDGTTEVTGHGDTGLLESALGSYEGTFGPGHNSFTIDENGNPVIIYHARDWADSYPGATGSDKYGLVDPGRHAYAKHVIFNAEGFPVCNLSAEEYLASSLENVSIKIQVGEKEVQQAIVPTQAPAAPTAAPADSVKKGDKKTIGNAKYIVKTIKKNGTGTVSFAGPKKKTIKKITIPNAVKIDGKKFKVTAVEKKAFYNCKKLKTVTIKAVNIKKVGKNAFKGTSSKLKLKFPKKKQKAYKKLFKL